jgi:hypothetical protein
MPHNISSSPTDPIFYVVMIAIFSAVFLGTIIYMLWFNPYADPNSIARPFFQRVFLILAGLALSWASFTFTGQIEFGLLFCTMTGLGVFFALVAARTLMGRKFWESHSKAKTRMVALQIVAILWAAGFALAQITPENWSVLSLLAISATLATGSTLLGPDVLPGSPSGHKQFVIKEVSAALFGGAWLSAALWLAQLLINWLVTDSGWRAGLSWVPISLEVILLLLTTLSAIPTKPGKEKTRLS